ncbi:putative pentatricopeptide repeat-containing protein [Spatholobus suberectus]|nr:putative pentatricopeptide repeat-containing protein [Spatholobus suberectus]
MSSCSKRCLILLEKCKNMKHLKQAQPKYITSGLDTNTLLLAGSWLSAPHPHQGSLTYACRVFERIHHPTLCICNTIIKCFLLNGKLYDTLHVSPRWCTVVGDVDSARLFFDEAPEKDRGIWGAMISGYVQNNCFKEGLYLFRLLQLTDVVPDESIFVSILSACAHLGALDIGIWIHRYLNRAMRDIVCWNAMISGMAMHGDGASALKLFTDMERTGMKPDDITFVAVFTACSYSGMAHEEPGFLRSYGYDEKNKQLVEWLRRDIGLESISECML